MYRTTNLITFVLFILLLNHLNFSQPIEIAKIEPPNWWAGMKNNKVQLMVYGSNLNGVTAKSENPGIKVNTVHKIKNPNYAFIDIEISNKLKPGNYVLTLSKGKQQSNINYRINERKPSANRYQGFSNKDVIYLITPDRFANGDSLNDNFIGMIDQYNPGSPLGRHGGDIQGIINNLDHIKDLGVTAIWINPLVENNTKISYHGYAATDLYKIDARFGTNELYARLVEEAHKRGLKIILDHVSNHIGITHPWMNNLPVEDWINGSKGQHLITPHYGRAIFDIHSDSTAINNTRQGWFVDEMPDLNQTNPYAAKYFIQNTLWWIETTGLDGIREDTYYYPDLKFLSEWAKSIFTEYPKFNIVGEIWIGTSAFLAPFQDNSKLGNFDTNLPSVTDFAFRDAAAKVLTQGKSLYDIYEVIAKDFLFPDPDNLVTFIDNHDIERIMYLAKDDIRKFKMMLGLLLTTRGIPQIYYGTEIGMKGGTDHGEIREDFPGGFKSSTHNAFTKKGRSRIENDIYDFTKHLLNLRNTHTPLTSGKLIHYPPVDETYYYFRVFKNEKILIIINNNESIKEVDVSLGKNYLNSTGRTKDLTTGKEVIIKNNKITMEPFSFKILQVM